MDWVDDNGYDNDPPEILHEGGELNNKTRTTFEYIVLPRYVCSLMFIFSINLCLCRYKSRKQVTFLKHRRARLEALHKNWADQMPAAVDAYLEWKHGVHNELAEPDANGSVFEVTAISTFCKFVPKVLSELF